MPPSHRSGKQVGRAVIVQIFPSQIYVFWVLLIYSFHAPFHPSSRNTETPIKVIRLHPGPCRKGPIIAPHAKECPMNTGSHMCVPARPVPSWRAFALPLHEEGGGGRPAADGGEGEKATSNGFGPGAAKQMSPGLPEAEPGWKIIFTRASPRLRKRGYASKHQDQIAHLRASIILEQ